MIVQFKIAYCFVEFIECNLSVSAFGFTFSPFKLVVII